MASFSFSGFVSSNATWCMLRDLSAKNISGESMPELLVHVVVSSEPNSCSMEEGGGGFSRDSSDSKKDAIPSVIETHSNM